MIPWMTLNNGSSFADNKIEHDTHFLLQITYCRDQERRNQDGSSEHNAGFKQNTLESINKGTKRLTLEAENFPFWQSPEANDMNHVDTKPGGCL